MDVTRSLVDELNVPWDVKNNDGNTPFVFAVAPPPSKRPSVGPKVEQQHIATVEFILNRLFPKSGKLEDVSLFSRLSALDPTARDMMFHQVCSEGQLCMLKRLLVESLGPDLFLKGSTTGAHSVDGCN